MNRGDTTDRTDTTLPSSKVLSVVSVLSGTRLIGQARKGSTSTRTTSRSTPTKILIAGRQRKIPKTSFSMGRSLLTPCRLVGTAALRHRGAGPSVGRPVSTNFRLRGWPDGERGERQM